MSAALSGSPGLQAAAPFELQQPCAHPSALDGLCAGLLGGLSGLSGVGAPESPYSPAASAASNLAGAAASSLGALPASTPADALAQLALLQQQQQLVAALEADPLLSLTNLLAAQQGLNTRVAELLALKQHLAASPPPSRPGGGIRGTGPLANPLYKTELCRSWEETGSCRYGAKCQFAHGREELRPVVRHPKYKTEICRTFAQSGTCPYGTRCRFIHSTCTAARTGSTTPHTGTGTPAPTPTLSRDASFASLPGLAASPSTPATPPLLPFSHSLPSMHGLASLSPSPTASPLLAADTATAASLLGLQSLQGMGAGASAYLPTASAGLTTGGATVGLGTASAGYGYGQLAAGQLAGAQLGGADPSTLAALATLLAGRSLGSAATAAASVQSLGSAATAAASVQPLGPSATLATSPHSFLGVVGPPAGLAPIGTVGGSAAGAAGYGLAQPLSCPSTPGGTSARAALRRSISDSDASTPTTKRLPIFEQLIPDSVGAEAPASTPASAAGSRRTSFDTAASGAARAAC
ncbi:hypothetical protein ABPG75_005336 [Micractinium tetrahymenae]